MRHARYVGARPELMFCDALVRPDPRSKRHLLAQFDCMRPYCNEKVRPGYGIDEALPLCFGWHRFKRSEFKMRRRLSQSDERREGRSPRWWWRREPRL